MSRSMAASMSWTILRVLALAVAGEVLLDVDVAEELRRAQPSTAEEQRFQRGRCSGWPLSLWP